MRRFVLILLFGLLMTTHAQAAQLPDALLDSVPPAAESILRDTEVFDAGGFSQGVHRILEDLQSQAGNFLRQRLRGVVLVLFVVVLCGAVESLTPKSDKTSAMLLPMAGALSITAITAGNLDVLMGLGVQSIHDLSRFSKVLLPVLAAATASSGAVTTATFQQVTTVFFVDFLLSLMNGLLIPMVYLYIGVLTASACLPDLRLSAIAEALKKVVTWILTTSLLVFTVYLSVVRVIAGAADGTTVKLTKAALSGVVPIVGKIIAEASETVLAGAGLLKNGIGIFGMLAVLAVCAYPFLQLGIQYLLYKLAGFLASVIGVPRLYKLIDGLGGAFGLVLGMTGSSAILLLISVISSLTVVIS